MRRYPRITPARLSEQDPFLSLDFQDYYFSLKDPLAERHAIFVDGLDLPKRFRALSDGAVFRIGETGFGAGLTWLLVAQCFLTEAPETARLQWVSVERYPLRRADLKRLLSGLPLSPQLDRLAQALVTVWPEPVAGGHRRRFAEDRLIVDVHFDDASAVFSELYGSVDAWCLDGFSPEQNPDLWSPTLFQAIADRSAHRAPLSTYTAASRVRAGLSDVGFLMRKEPGFAGKRERLAGTFQGQPQTRPFHPPMQERPPEQVVVVGGGLSGAWVAAGLASRGIPVTVYEKHLPAAGASGNPQGVTYAKLSIEATPASQIQLQALTHLKTWLADAPGWHPTGVLLLAEDGESLAQQDKLQNALALPTGVLAPVDVQEASDIAGARLVAGGLHLPGGGWLQPKTLIQWLLSHRLIRIETYHQIETAVRHGTETRLHMVTPQGRQVVSAPVVVWGNAHEAVQFSAMHLPLRPVRGQITQLATTESVRAPVCGAAYIAPALDGVATCGATYEPKSSDLTPRSADNLDNLARTQGLFATTGLHAGMIQGERVAIRASTPDYAPVVGQLADPSQWTEALQGLATDASYQPKTPLCWVQGQYVIAGQGSRGTLTAPMTAEILISQITGEISPVSARVVSALAPDRFFRRALIRGQQLG